MFYDAIIMLFIENIVHISFEMQSLLAAHHHKELSDDLHDTLPVYLIDRIMKVKNAKCNNDGLFSFREP